MAKSREATPKTGGAKKRIEYFDNLKGVLILLVVLGHFVTYMPKNGSALLASTAQWIYMFHMPAFILVSGIFASKTYSEEKGFKGENAIYYFALCFVFCGLSWLLSVAYGTPGGFNFFKQGSAPWYLWAMAIYALCTPLFYRLKPGFVFVILFIVALLSGVWLNDSNCTLFSCARVMVYAPFFAIGYYIGIGKAVEIQQKVFSSKMLALWRIIAIAVLASIFAILYYCNSHDIALGYFLKKVSTGWNTFEVLGKGNDLTTLQLMGIRIGGYCWGLLMTASIALLVPQKCKLFNLWGRRSLQVYILHMLVLNVMSHFAVNKIMLASYHWWLLTPFVFAPILVTILSSLGFIETWLNALKRLCGKSVRAR